MAQEISQQEFNWPLFIVGCVSLAVAVGLAIWAFSLRHLTDDQYLILLWALPVASGFVAGSFTGIMRVTGPWKEIAFGAVGGFAVWLITLLVLPGPSASTQSLGISRFDFYDERHTSSDGLNVALTNISQRSNRDYDVKSANDLKIAFGFVVKGFSVQSGRSIQLRIRIAILNNKRETLVEDDLETYDDLSEWTQRPITAATGTTRVLSALQLPQSEVDAGTAMPVIVLLEDFKDAEVPKGKGFIQIQLSDVYGKGTYTHEEKFEVNFLK